MKYADRDLYRQGGVSAHIQATDCCNLCCKGCYVAKKSEKFMSIDDLEIAVDKIESANISGIFYEASGGELLFHPKWEKIIRLLLSTNREVYANTNATLITPESASSLAEFQGQSGGRLFLSASLDSHAPEIHNSMRGEFEETIRGLALMKEYGVRFRVNTRIAQENADSIAETLRYVMEEFTPEISLGVTRPVFQITEETKGFFVPYKKILQLHRDAEKLAYEAGGQLYHSMESDEKFRCSAGINRFAVMPDGTVTGCYALRLPRDSLGNIFIENPKTIFERMSEFADRPDLEKLLCEWQQDIWGEPQVRLGRQK